MSSRLWLFIAGFSGAFAVVMGAVIKHRSQPLEPEVLQSLLAGQLYHILHSLALLGVAILLIATEERRAWLATLFMQAAGVAFAGGIVLFSFGIYGALDQGAVIRIKTVPLGGMLFIAGWAFLGLSAFGIESGDGKR